MAKGNQCFFGMPYHIGIEKSDAFKVCETECRIAIKQGQAECIQRLQRSGFWI